MFRKLRRFLQLFGVLAVLVGALFYAHSAIGADDLSQHLVAEYRFGTCATNPDYYTLTDHTGNLPEGKLMGNTSIGAGKIDKGMVSDGSNGSDIWVADNDGGTPDDRTDDTLSSPEVDIVGDLTLSVWVYPDGYKNEVILSRSHNGEFWFGMSSSGRLVYAHHGESTIASSAVVPANGWHHVALVRTGTSPNFTLKFYVDGQLQDTLTYDKPVEATNRPLEIGSCQVVCGGYNFKGKIDEVKIFDAAATDSDIQNIYNNENAGKNYDGTTRCAPGSWCETGFYAQLQNGSFEDGGGSTAGWSGTGYVSSSYPSPDGTYYAYTVGGHGPLYQDVSITAGNEYRITFFAASHQPQAGDKTVKVQYLDSNHQPLGQPVTWVVQHDVDDDNHLSPMRLLSAGLAPSGAAYLRVSADAGSSDYTKVDAFCMYETVLVPPTASLGDFVWHDTNYNGLQDAGESGVPNVTVQLYENDSCSGSPAQTATTDASGNYAFTDLAPGTYSVKFVLPSGYVFSPANQGDDTKDSDADTTTGCTGAITLNAGDNATQWDAGIYQPASLGDLVWEDTNGDGLQDTGESGIEGVTVELYSGDACSGTAVATATTDANGNYAFNNLVPGTYSVKFVKPTGYEFSPPNQGDDTKDSDADPGTGCSGGVTLAEGQNDTTVDAGLYQPASLGDLVWNDEQVNGLQDPGESGVQGVSVSLYTTDDCSGTAAATTTTDANGNYHFNNLAPGTYSVKFDLPTGFVFTAANQGDDTKDSDADPATGCTGGITLASGQDDPTWDAGIHQYTDYGDAPNSYNATTFAQDGARHIVTSNLYMGDCVDADVDGQPSADADGDDTNTGYHTEGSCATAGDDEDGIDIAAQPEISNADGGFVRRWKASVHVDPAVTTAYLYGWIDFDRNGTFDADELAVATLHGGDTTALLEWTIPTDVTAGDTYARFRLSTAANLGPTGAAPDGEVEDYKITIRDFLPGVPQCNDAFYQTRANPANNYRFRFDQLDFSTNPIGEIPHDSGPSPKVQDLTSGQTNLNAIGFNIQDGYIYAMTWDPNSPRPFLSKLARINPNTGGFQVLGEVLAASDVTFQGNVIHQGEPLKAQNVLNVGDVDRSGKYYVGSASPASQNTDIAVIDLKNMTFSVVPLTEGGSPAHLSTADFAFNPQDGKLYAIRVNSNKLIRIDPATGVITVKDLQAAIPNQQGGAVFDQSGHLYALVNSDSSGNGPYRVYRVTVADPTPALELRGVGSEPAIVNDGAGCLISRDYGDLPDSYGTLKASGGASHVLMDGDFNGTVDLFLGAKVDADNDGFVDGVDDTQQALDDDQPVGTGTGNGDDEDGITLATPLIPGAEACVQVSAHNETGNTAHLYGWFDWNGDGHFDATEQVNTGDFSGGSATIATGDTNNQTLCFTVPSTATFSGGKAYFRFRLTTASLSAADWGGSAPDGEVEDYMTPLACVGNLVWNDSTGTTQDQQDANDTGVSGVQVRLVWAGPDGSIDTAPNQAAQNDDKVYTITTDSNGVYSFCGLTAGNTYQVQLANAPTGLPEAVEPNQGDSFHDSNGLPVTNGFVASPFTITDATALPTGENGNQDTGSAGFANNFPDNQVNESIDFGFRPEMKDYGDAPDTYKTAKASGGPNHIIDPDLYLGSCVDAELDAATPLDASGDDGDTGYYTAGTCATAGDDEDGVTLATPLLPGAKACVKVTAHNALVPAQDAHLYGWFDWNGDGQFSDAEALNSVDFSGGSATIPSGGVADQTYCFNVPADATFSGGKVYFRFRLTTASLTASDWAGDAPDGEVEDYVAPLACVGSLVWNDSTGTAQDRQDANDTGVDNAAVTLRWDGDGNGSFTDPNDISVSATTANGGKYYFCGLTPGSYRLEAMPPSGLPQAVAPNQGADPAKDSNGVQASSGAPSTDDFTISNVTALPTAEDGNGDLGAAGGPNNFPDAQVDETHDFGFRPQPLDWGDAPDTFATTAASHGASHVISSSLYLGGCVDADLDGQPSAHAGLGGGGDDHNNGYYTVGTCLQDDDEDGLLSAITPGPPGGKACFTVAAKNSTGNDARLYAWVDWNGDGQFQDNEQLTGEDFGTQGYAVIPDGTTPTAPQTLCFTMPPLSQLTLEGGETHARLRLTTQDLSARGGSDPLWAGPASDGEVEDYWSPAACIGNYLWEDSGATENTQDSDDLPLSGMAVRLLWAGPNGTIDTAPSDTAAQSDDVILGTVTTDANGIYQFCGLPAGVSTALKYQVQVLPKAGYYSVTKNVGAADHDSNATPEHSLASGWAADEFSLLVDYTAAPGYIKEDGNDMPLNESGNEDAVSAGNSNNFPDARTDWTQDLGFKKYEDYGDLPSTFDGTTPAAHPLRPDLYLGGCVDAESANQPGATADGDDTGAGDYTVGTCATANDDEDGVTLVTPLLPGAEACVEVTAHNATGGNAYLYGWFDWNGNGQFDSGEQLDSGDFSGGKVAIAGDVTAQKYCFSVPDTATFDGGKVYYRFRLTTQDDLASPTGEAADGEVEDYVAPLACVGSLVWNDSTGTAQDQQDANDTGVDNAAVTLRWDGDGNGSFTDPSDIAVSATTANGGKYYFCGLTAGSYRLEAAPPSGLPQAVAPNQGADPAKDSNGVQASSGAPSTDDFTISDVTALPTAEDGNGDLGAAGGPNNFPDAQVDETHDFGFRPQPLDWGDNPDTYGTTAAAQGASHVISPTLYLGACVDGELDGQASAQADGDDTNTGYFTEGTCVTAGDDEDGVTLVTPLLPGQQACVQVDAHNATGNDAKLYAWFDWNGDGQFSADEQVATGDFNGGAATVPDGGVSGRQYCFTVPANATFNGGEVHMRFRLTTASLAAADWKGTAPDGEVEDYWSPLACVGNFVWDDTDGSVANEQDSADAPISGLTLNLTWAGQDGNFGTADDVTTSTTTDAQGRYTFCGLTPASQVQISIPNLPDGLNQPVTPDQGTDLTDSDASQSGGLGSAVVLPPITVPGLSDLAAGNWVTGENATQDASTQADPALTHNYPDGRTDLTFDVGLRKVKSLSDKEVSSTNQDFTAGSDVAVGEIITYKATLSLSPGTVNNLKLTDVLAKGLAFQQCESITATGNITASAGTLDSICQHPTVSAYPAGSADPVDQGRQVVWNFGSVTNSGTDDATLTVTYTVVVLDSAGNTSGADLDNKAVWSWDAGSDEASAPPVTVVEPDLSISKSASPTIVLPDEPITFTILVKHTPKSQTNAYDVVVTDKLPPAFQYVDASLEAVAGPTPATMSYDAATRTITVVWDVMPLGEEAKIQFKATMGAPSGVVINNSANVAWTSLPGDVSQPQSQYNELSTERGYDPASNVDVYGAQAEAAVRMGLPKTGFAPGRVTTIPVQKVAYDQLSGLVLEIPKLGLKLPIVGVPRNKDGWDLTWLWNNAGWLEGTAFPTWPGNTALTAHVYLPNGEPGPFVNLYTLEWGDKVIIHANGERYIYEVRAVKRVKPNDISVLGHKERDWVTLITCEGFDEKTDAYRWRLVVQAVLVKVEPEP